MFKELYQYRELLKTSIKKEILSKFREAIENRVKQFWIQQKESCMRRQGQ